MRKSGFTIIELLIVIVVIAILAAVSIVAYNGVQTRANNTQTAQAMKQYIQAFNLYALDNGDYPGLSGCLGEGYAPPNNRCLSQNGTAACFSTGAATSLSTSNALKPYMNNQAAKPSMQEIPCGGSTYVGMYVWYDSATKIAHPYMVLKGDVPCPDMSPNVTSVLRNYTSDATRCRYSLAPGNTL